MPAAREALETDYRAMTDARMLHGPREQKERPLCSARSLKNGAKRTRTADPLHAMQVLYQLSYGPVVIDWLA